MELVDDPASSADGLLGREHEVGGAQRGVVLGGHAGSPPPVARRGSAARRRQDLAEPVERSQGPLEVGAGLLNRGTVGPDGG